MDHSFIDQFGLPGLVTCAGIYQMGTFVKAVGKARMKYKVSPPETNGPPEFNRIFRAQQNCLEFYPISVVSLWLTSVFVHPVPASLLYVGYLHFRNQYFQEYAKDSEKRVKPFYQAIRFLQLLVWLGALGAGHKVLRYYGNIDLFKVLMNAIPSLTN